MSTGAESNKYEESKQHFSRNVDTTQNQMKQLKTVSSDGLQEHSDEDLDEKSTQVHGQAYKAS